MNTKLFTLAILEIIISIGITVAIIFVSFKILKLLFFRSSDLRGDNMAFTIYGGLYKCNGFSALFNVNQRH